VADRAPISFGLSLTPAAERSRELLQLASLADGAGLEYLGIQDHPYQRRFLDTWMLLAVVAARTERIRVFPDVANLPLRPPAMMAKAAASLDRLSGGRFELGIGAGSFWEAVEAMGGERRSPGESVEALAEAIELIRRCWSGEGSVSLAGQHYRVRGYKPGPPPAHEIEIWIGAYRPRMLRLTGRMADGWVPSHGYLTPREASEAAKLIDDAAERTGREPAEIRRVYNVGGRITGGERGEDELEGPPQHWAERLAAWHADPGFDTFVFWPREEIPEQVELFAAEVVPAVRDAVNSP
jgi:alkanesulfonate monooxygenase SsuD/methylene tetrahydromethanopterin reductase-like flavin-dependent oxidoreductase (luciferase family)